MIIQNNITDSKQITETINKAYDISKDKKDFDFIEFYNNVTESSLNDKQKEIMNNIVKKAVNINETN